MKIKQVIASLLLYITAAVTVAAQAPSRYELVVKDFTELLVLNSINVDYKCNPDSAGIAVFDATPQEASMIMFSNNGKNRLTIQLSDDARDRTELPVVTVYSNFLLQVENSADSLVRVVSVAPGAKFKAILMGNGRLSVHEVTANQVDASIKRGNGQMVVTGRCQSANLSNTGTGSIQADELAATNVKCSVMGSGSIGCCAKENLSVQGMGLGNGTVFYKGTPTIKDRSVHISLVNIQE